MLQKESGGCQFGDIKNIRLERSTGLLCPNHIIVLVFVQVHTECIPGRYAVGFFQVESKFMFLCHNHTFTIPRHDCHQIGKIGKHLKELSQAFVREHLANHSVVSPIEIELQCE